MNIKDFITTNQFKPYDDEIKKEFKRLGHKFMHDLAHKCDAIDMNYTWNPGGIAVSGDHTLVLTFPEEKYIYVTFNADGLSDLGILYRTMKHKKDWTGGVNNWCKWENCDSLHERINGLARVGNYVA